MIKQFNVTTIGTPFSVYIKNNITYSPQLHKVEGEPENIEKFFKDLRKDKKISNVEIEGNNLFLIEVQKKKKVTASIFSTLGPKIIFVKPVFVDKEGYEYWEVASWEKEILAKFIEGIIKEVSREVEVLKLEQTKLKDIYFSHLMPNLTVNQSLAIRLAFERGYYLWPRKTSLGKLAKEAKISIPTFREHLKKAEEKLMPNLISQVKP
ncbi:helix-turn-helix domain-containing protein [Candidatus Pacearchaeota archaeon]|nr:helix-turn-helix domain-containing protein [Candidatus Pacearchaeota archaeon]